MTTSFGRYLNVLLLYSPLFTFLFILYLNSTKKVEVATFFCSRLRYIFFKSAMQILSIPLVHLSMVEKLMGSSATDQLDACHKRWNEARRGDDRHVGSRRSVEEHTSYFPRVYIDKCFHLQNMRASNLELCIIYRYFCYLSPIFFTQGVVESLALFAVTPYCEGRPVIDNLCRTNM